jgi:hypothetical protein
MLPPHAGSEHVEPPKPGGHAHADELIGEPLFSQASWARTEVANVRPAVTQINPVIVAQELEAEVSQGSERAWGVEQGKTEGEVTGQTNFAGGAQ